ncbi:multiple 11-like epidermal growth factor-like domains protein, partial [Mytilus galloprovincialis]
MTQWDNNCHIPDLLQAFSYIKHCGSNLQTVLLSRYVVPVEACPSGTNGLNCKEECFCAHDAECDPVTGDCLCTAGWYGNHCTKECPMGTFGIKCSGMCNCPDGETCDTVTGNCNTPKDPIDTMSNTSIVSKFETRAILNARGMIVKVKETVCRQVQKPKKDTSKPKLKRRLAKRRRSSVQTHDAQTGSFIIDSEFSVFRSPMEEDALDWNKLRSCAV